LEKARTCAFQANCHLIWATNYRRKVLLGSVEVRLEMVLKTIAYQSGFALLAVRVHHGDHVHLFQRFRNTRLILKGLKLVFVAKMNSLTFP
jgi:REP element-mobilizing transposase RayT